jgi:hypothetical protein
MSLLLSSHGNIMLIGMPPNILAASILADRGLLPFRFLDSASSHSRDGIIRVPAHIPALLSRP